MCAYRGALQSAVWGGPGGVDQQLSQLLLAVRQMLSTGELRGESRGRSQSF